MLKMYLIAHSKIETNPMLIPKYWAQYKQRFDSKIEFDNAKKQATIKRYGWSDISQNDALIHAKARVADARNRWLAGEDIVRRECKEQYNQSNAIPIREAIISNQSFSTNKLTTQVIVTRNSYGAQVANVNNVAIIDIDTIDLLLYLYPNDYNNYDKFISAPPTLSTNIKLSDTKSPINTTQKSAAMKLQVWGFVIVSIIIASVIAWQSWSWAWLILIMILGTALLWRQASKNEQEHHQANKQKYETHLAELQPFMTDLIEKRVARYPNERFRLYETPAGFRIIATHDTILPSDDVVAEWFEYFHADANYARLCQVQQCFRARLTAKPWRMVEVDNNKLNKQIPAKNFWFTDISLDDASLDAMDEEQYDDFEKQQFELVARQQWIDSYDRFAKNYKACRYIKSFGDQQNNSSSSSKAVDEFVAWHDDACQVDKDLPIA